jgi:hypothetical protein
MACLKFKGKGTLCVLFSAFLSSCTQAPRQWQLSSNQGIHPDFESSRLYLSAEDEFTGLELDILNTSQGQVVHLNALGLELQPEGKSPEGYPIIHFQITIDEQSHPFTGFLLQGGHRILLPEDATRLIVETLHARKSIEITVAHCSTTVVPDQFAKLYKKALN